MKIGVPKEIKNNEFRVSITPLGVRELISNGHEVFIEKNAGLNSSFRDQEYISAGGKILNDNKSIFKISDLILKVKEPIADFMLSNKSSTSERSDNSIQSFTINL